MSEITIRLDDKTFSTVLPKPIAEARFLDMCALLLKDKGDKKSSKAPAAGKPPAADKPPVSGEPPAEQPHPSPHDVNDTLSLIPHDFSFVEEGVEGGEEPRTEDMAESKTAEAGPADAEKESDPEEETYRGFLHIVCEGCGRAFTFNAKKPTNSFECRECGHITKLHNLGRMKLTCECGKSWRYRTNATSELVELNCVACQSPMVARIDKYGDYWPLKD